jgi:hypothetical protein
LSADIVILVDEKEMRFHRESEDHKVWGNRISCALNPKPRAGTKCACTSLDEENGSRSGLCSVCSRRYSNNRVNMKLAS